MSVTMRTSLHMSSANCPCKPTQKVPLLSPSYRWGNGTSEEDKWPSQGHASVSAGARMGIPECGSRVHSLACCPIVQLQEFLWKRICISLPLHMYTHTHTHIYVYLQGIFLTQGLNPHLLHCRQILYHLSHQRSHIYIYIYIYIYE